METQIGGRTGQWTDRSADTQAGGHIGPPLLNSVDKDGTGTGGIYGDGGTGIESQGLLLNDPSSSC